MNKVIQNFILVFEIRCVCNRCKQISEEQFDTDKKATNKNKTEELHNKEVDHVDDHSQLSKLAMGPPRTTHHVHRIFHYSYSCKQSSIHPSSSLFH